MEKLLDSRLLKPGVFVCRLDRPWLDTPFLLQGFVVRTEDEIEQLQHYCRHVYIDTERGDDPVGALDVESRPEQPPVPPPPRHPDTPPHSPGDEVQAKATAHHKPAPSKAAPWPYHVPIEQELEAAFDIHRLSRMAIGKAIDDLRLGRSLDSRAAKAAVSEIAESILRNPDALAFLTQLRVQNQYLPFHSINVCIFAMVFGRHLGLSKAELHTLGIGALLHDVGYTQLPQALLNKAGPLTGEEFALIKTHVAAGAHILRDTPGIPAAALDIVDDHHERWDGSGYPRGAREQAISLSGRLGAIVDAYDAATTDRPWRAALTPYEALDALYRSRGKQFDEDLVLQFIQCVGIYPPGSFVELTTGDIGIVLASHPDYRLLPKVGLLLDAQHARYDSPVVLDLLSQQGADKPIKIRAGVRPGEHGLGPRDLMAFGFPMGE